MDDQAKNIGANQQIQQGGGQPEESVFAVKLLTNQLHHQDDLNQKQRY